MMRKFLKIWGKKSFHLDRLDPNDMPDQILPKGLDFKRQQYLYNEIREFVAEDKQDLVCPLPQVRDEVSDSGDEVLH